jgi:hypothetical protein
MFDFDKIRTAARNVTKDVVKEAPAFANKTKQVTQDAVKKVEPFAKEVVKRGSPFAKEASSTVQKYAKEAAKEAQKYAKSGQPQNIAKEHFVNPATKIIKRGRNWGLIIGGGAIAIFGFSYGMSHALVSGIRNDVFSNVRGTSE